MQCDFEKNPPMPESAINGKAGDSPNKVNGHILQNPNFNNEEEKKNNQI